VLRQYEAGRLVVAQSGCLACHIIGHNGNNGPGPPLTTIGARLPKQAILQTLINPTKPMPSFKGLPSEQLNQMSAYLAQLKSEH
jgi:mono/diheme cytochrome c family protein